MDVTPQKDMDLSPQKNIDVKLQKNIDMTPQKDMDVSSQKNVDVTPEKNVNVSPQKDMDVSPQKNVDVTPEKNVNVTPQKNMDLTPEESERSVNPKETDNKLSSAKKRQQKQISKEDREKKRQEEQQKKEEKLKEKKEKEEKKRLEKEQRELQKRKEKEEREEQKRKEKEEREEQKRKEREEKEEQKRKEREEKEEQKRREHEQRELKKQQEKQRLEEKFKKEKALFANFFVHKRPISATDNKTPDKKVKRTYAFMQFEVKTDMRLAPLCRRSLTIQQKDSLEDHLAKQTETTLYLSELKSGVKPRKCECTWPHEDDVFIVEENEIGERVEQHATVGKMKAKILKFHDNRRPAYFGTWRKRSKYVKGRRPFGQDKDLFDYDVDSDDDWEEEDPGESLHGSDDEEKDNEGDDYELNEFFVPHGYLSDDENTGEDIVPPDSQKIKLKLLESEFFEERNNPMHHRLKARMIGPLWERPGKTENSQLELFFHSLKMISKGTVVIKRRSSTASHAKPILNRKSLIPELIPKFLELLHGNVNKRILIVDHFHKYLIANHNDAVVSKASLVALAKQLAMWQKCPEKGLMYNRPCWYVSAHIQKQYNLELTLPRSELPTLMSSYSNENKKSNIVV